MSFQVYFSLSWGFNQPLHCPAGTLAGIREHVGEVEEILGLKMLPPGDGNVKAYGPTCGGRWDHFDPAYRQGFPGIKDELLCETVEKHNWWVRWMYDNTAKWAKAEPFDGGETITPEIGATFWHALSLLEVAPERWTGDYYRARMESLYEVMRGRGGEGMSFDAKALTPCQAAAVIRMFDQYLDPEDLRLDVPVGCDFLASSADGGYVWCEKHGAIADDDLDAHSRRRCPLGTSLRENA